MADFACSLQGLVPVLSRGQSAVNKETTTIASKLLYLGSISCQLDALSPSARAAVALIGRMLSLQCQL